MENTITTSVNRTYKATVFTLLFEDWNNLLELYNAMSGKHYEDPDLLEINTLENAIYMSVRNDLSFLVDGRLSLYEHQSTYSPNLPLRFLFYVSHLFSKLTKEENLYGRKAVELPTPEFIIFYNGEEEAADRAIEECIREGVLKEFLEKHRAEARMMSIFEYDQEKHLRMEREEAWQEGRDTGLKEGKDAGKEEKLLELVQRKLEKGKSAAQIAEELEEEETAIIDLMKRKGL